MERRAAPVSGADLTTQDDRQRNLHGIRCMVLSMAAYIVNDTLVKVVSESLPSGQLIFVRGLFATVAVLLWMRLTGTTLRWRELADPWVALRAGVDALASVTYLISLFHMPIANATAINMATPLVITLLAGPLLGERVSARQWLLIGAGFAGVLLVAQPGLEGFNVYAWLCVFATVLNAVRDLIVRRIAAGVSSAGITLSTAVAATALAGLMTLPEGWTPMTGAQLGLLAAAAMFLATGYAFTVAATRAGDLSVVAPFRYTALVLAVLLGWLVWGDVPNVLAWIGIALVVGTGVALLRLRGR